MSASFESNLSLKKDLLRRPKLSYSKIFLISIFICISLPITDNSFAAVKGYYQVPNCHGELIRPVVQLKGKSLPVNEVFILEVLDPAASKELKLLSFDAVMPAHNHGMVLKPKIFKDKNSSWRIEGVKLHMAGDWQLIFSWEVGASKTKTICKIHI